MPASRPDILIVMADQLTPSALPSYGHGLTHAPAITALADQGVVFDNAYTASPLCSPARASFMTGLLPSRSGTYDNAAEFRAEIPTFAHHLRRLGYRTVLSGKMHFCGPDQLHGFEERLTTDIYPADYGWTPDWDRPHERLSWYHDMSSVVTAGECLRSNQLDFDDEVAFTSERALYDHVRTEDPRPLCLVVSFSHPHDPFAIPKRFYDLYRDEDIPMPAVTLADEQLSPHERRLHELCAMDALEVTEEHVRHARRAYYGAISYVDAHLARLLGVLTETDRLDRTVVVVTSDHGEMLGERGFWYKMSFYEGAARVPLILRAPGLFAPGRVANAVTTMDLLPTLVELAGAEPVGTGALPAGSAEGGVSDGIDGRSLLGFIDGSDTRDEVAAEYLAEGAVAPIVMLRRDRWKFIHCPADPDQLFDLRADPHELVNLAGEPEQAELVGSFRAEVSRRWDLAALDRSVRQSQRRRRSVEAALAVGHRQPWDYQPRVDASTRYVRNHLDLLDIEAAARYPRV